MRKTAQEATQSQNVVSGRIVFLTVGFAVVAMLLCGVFLGGCRSEDQKQAADVVAKAMRGIAVKSTDSNAQKWAEKTAPVAEGLSLRLGSPEYSIVNDFVDIETAPPGAALEALTEKLQEEIRAMQYTLGLWQTYGKTLFAGLGLTWLFNFGAAVREWMKRKKLEQLWITTANVIKNWIGSGKAPDTAKEELAAAHDADGVREEARKLLKKT